MSNKSMNLVVAVLALSACQLNASVVHSNWIGGNEGEWWNPDNWSSGLVPGILPSVYDDFVTINSETEKTKIILGSPFCIDQLDCYGTIEFGSGSIWCNNGMMNHGYLEINSLEFSNKFWNQKSATLRINNVFDGQDTFNKGIILIRPEAAFYTTHALSNDGMIEIQGGLCANTGTFDCNGILKGFGVVESIQEFFNRGDIQATGGSLVCRTGNLFLQVGLLMNNPTTSIQIIHTDEVSDVNNLGIIEVNSGGGIAFDCNVVNEPNGIVKLLGGTLAAQSITHKAGAEFEGFGGITGNVVIDPNAVIKFTGPTNIVGDLTIEEGAVLDISDGTVLVTGDLTCNGGTIKTYLGIIIVKGEEKGTGCSSIVLN